jgi:lysophospholipase L1-like esterase
MAWRPVLCIFAQSVCGGCALLLSLWVHTPLTGTIALGLITGFGLLTEAAPPIWSQAVRKWGALGACASSVFVLVILVLDRSRPFTLEVYYAVICWAVAGSLLPAVPWIECPGPKRAWKLLSLAWVLLGCGVWLVSAYIWNRPTSFYAGLALTFACLVWAKLWFRMPWLAVQAVNTSLLLLVGLPVADAALRPTHRVDTRPETRRRLFSYEAARQDPAAFALWWRYYLDEWAQVTRVIHVPDPAGLLPWRLRPGAEARFFQSQIHINRRGFRGPEIVEPKGSAFRIVALGESTTFGATLNAEDKPWPEVLEEMIRTRLHPDRPVQVINAGVSAYTLEHNLRRLEDEILPLQPDLIISYHGWNGFPMLYGVLPEALQGIPPAYSERPLKLLADAEYRLKLILHRNRQPSMSPLVSKGPPPLQSRYAQAYRQLIDWCRSHRIPLALANYAMAVNSGSSTELCEFYRAGFPGVFWQIQANRSHTQIVGQLARENPGTILVDAQRDLDGRYGKFIDLVHFTQEGRNQLAENMFADLQATLQTSLGRRPTGE